MRIIKSEDGSFDFEYEPGVTCTANLFAPTINLYKPSSPYFEDDFSGLFQIVFSEYKDYLDSNVFELHDGLIFNPNYIYHYKPGIWPRNTLFQILDQVISKDDYETAAQIKSELTLLPHGPIAISAVSIDLMTLRLIK